MVGRKRGNSEGREEGSWGSQEDEVLTRSDAVTHPSTNN